MNSTEQTSQSGRPRALHVVLYEGAGAEPMDGQSRFESVKALLERGFAVSRSTQPLQDDPGEERNFVVFGKVSGSLGGPVTDIAGKAPAEIAELVEERRSSVGARRPGEWKPWFPVIDYDRCTNCMQCLSFCLFGVYGVDDAHRIQAQNEENCKTNCPACSRVCPEAAIMFPKYKAGPINGDVVRDGDLGKEKMKVDISALLGGDVYSALRQRSDAAKARFSKERDEKKALQERQKCLAKLAQGGEIPIEVLMSLPSEDEILRRAEEAKAKAAAALAHQQN